MPSHEQNRETWNNSYDWSRYQGDEWSAKWGGPDMQWHWCILPRIQHHLPVATILDIGPGFGRWTEYLKEHCEQMVLVDISEKCIHHCRHRFGEEGMSYKVGSGDSLDGVSDDSIDFCFSWETLVYVEHDDLDRYLGELSRKLKSDGRAFLHHSNIGHYESYFNRTLKLPKSARDFLKKRGLLDYDQWRARSMTADSFRKLCEKHGLRVASQEWIPWGGKRMIDCLSVVQKQPLDTPFKTVENPDFHKRAYEIQRLSWLYGKGVPW